MRGWLRVGLVVVAGVIALTMIAGETPRPQAEDDVAVKPTTADLRNACQRRIRETLNDPRSVEWISELSWPVSFTTPDVATVNVQFRARNGFGGMVAEALNCTVMVRPSGDIMILTIERA